ncbi:hypothetical protein [Achromobacter phage Motura]|uniref:Uncharacterized protein n=1 Tax=Achromobacter phage Motura TaxID=2591403 RepID=A0A514CSU2_9CAUD|nr:hypothetical protein H1O15_gp246 [Achromobacter phage Motura]QDH83542.1 hypothetical protein [Achromobacter phage Motura]
MKTKRKLKVVVPCKFKHHTYEVEYERSYWSGKLPQYSATVQGEYGHLYPVIVVTQRLDGFFVGYVQLGADNGYVTVITNPKLTAAEAYAILARDYWENRY